MEKSALDLIESFVNYYGKEYQVNILFDMDFYECSVERKNPKTIEDTHPLCFFAMETLDEAVSLTIDTAVSLIVESYFEE